MRRGALDRVIDIECFTITGVSPSNEPIQEWVTFREDVFAEVYSRRGVELWSEAQSRRISETITRFRIDYSEAEGIDSAMRIKYEGQIYDIKAILPDHDRKQDVVIDAVLYAGSVDTPSLQAFCKPVLDAMIGEAYQCFIHIIGGTAPYTVSHNEGSPATSLPSGINIVQTSDTIWSIEGYPDQTGSFPISAIVQDAAGEVFSIPEFVLNIGGGDGSP